MVYSKIISTELIDNVKKYCGSCIYFSGEECGNGQWEGSEKYFDSDACYYYQNIESDITKK